MSNNNMTFSGAYSRRFSNAAAAGGAGTNTGTGSGANKPTGGDTPRTFTVRCGVGDAGHGTCKAVLQSVPSTEGIFGNNTVNQNAAQRYDKYSVKNTYQFQEGSIVRVMAQPDSGYRFVSWNSASTSNVVPDGYWQRNSFDVKVTKDFTIIANFEKINYPPDTCTIFVRVNDESMGEVKSNKNINNGAINVAKNTEVVLTARPAQGFQFVRWTGANFAGQQSNTDSTVHLIASRDETITAIFERIPGSNGGNGGGNGGNGGGNGGNGDDPSGRNTTADNPASPTAAGGASSIMAMLKKYWWVLAIAAFLYFNSRKGGKP